MQIRTSLAMCDPVSSPAPTEPRCISQQDGSYERMTRNSLLPTPPRYKVLWTCFKRRGACWVCMGLWPVIQPCFTYTCYDAAQFSGWNSCVACMRQTVFCHEMQHRVGSGTGIRGRLVDVSARWRCVVMWVLGSNVTVQDYVPICDSKLKTHRILSFVQKS